MVQRDQGGGTAKAHSPGDTCVCQMDQGGGMLQTSRTACAKTVLGQGQAIQEVYKLGVTEVSLERQTEKRLDLQKTSVSGEAQQEE